MLTMGEQIVVSRRRVLTVSAQAAVGMITGGSLLTDRRATQSRRVTEAAGPPQSALPADPTPIAQVAAPAPVARTIAARKVVQDGALRVARTDFRLSHLGVSWVGDLAMVRVHTADGWSAWRTMGGCGGAPDNARPGGNALLVVPGATGYEITVAGGGAAELTELNTVDGPVRTEAAATVVGMPLPGGVLCPVPYLSRAAWGADESLRFVNGVETWPVEYYPTQALTVHHSAGANNDPDPAATVRAIYHFQAIGEGWGDIGYHLLIDEAGRVYEGRVSGSDDTPAYGPTQGSTPLMNTAAHALGYNVGNIGVCLLGDLTSQQPTVAAQTSLVTVLASLAVAGNVNPLATVNYLSPVNGNTRSVLGVSGHRDWGATACPGNTFYPQLPSVRGTVAGLIPTVATPRVRSGPTTVQLPESTRTPPPPGADPPPVGRQR